MLRLVYFNYVLRLWLCVSKFENHNAVSLHLLVVIKQSSAFIVVKSSLYVSRVMELHRRKDVKFRSN